MKTHQLNKLNLTSVSDISVYFSVHGALSIRQSLGFISSIFLHFQYHDTHSPTLHWVCVLRKWNLNCDLSRYHRPNQSKYSLSCFYTCFMLFGVLCQLVLTGAAVKATVENWNTPTHTLTGNEISVSGLRYIQFALHSHGSSPWRLDPQTQLWMKLSWFYFSF